MTVDESENIKILSTLEYIEYNVPFVQSIRFYYPNINDGRLYYRDHSISFSTNDISRKKLEAAYKELSEGETGKVFSANTEINSLYLNDDGMLSVVDYFSVKVASAAAEILSDGTLPPIVKLQEFLKVVSSRLSALRTEALSELEVNFPTAYIKIQQKRQQIIFGNLTDLLRQGKQAGVYDPELDEILAAHVEYGRDFYKAHPVESFRYRGLAQLHFGWNRFSFSEALENQLSLRPPRRSERCADVRNFSLLRRGE